MFTVIEPSRPAQNLRAINAGLAAEPREITVAAWHHAEDDLLADTEAYTDWLSAECAHHCDVRTGYVPEDAVDLAERIDGMTVPQLWALALYPRAEAAYAAMSELQRRFLADPETQARLQQMAAEA